MAFLRHKRDANARLRLPQGAVRIAAPVAVVATLASVSAGVLAANPEPTTANVTADTAGFTKLTRDDDALSRSAARLALDAGLLTAGSNTARMAEQAATQAAVRNARQKLWTTDTLNLWDSALRKAKLLGTIDTGKQVLVTGRRANERAEVVLGGKPRWVTAAYLSARKPEPPKPVVSPTESGSESGSSGSPTLGGECSNGSSVSGGANVIDVHQAVCAAFPSITSYGTYRDDGEHAQGLAIDIMISGDTGWDVANFLRSHYSELGISYIIYSQKIWSVDRSGEGWRSMEDRGSTTANHYDHVHVTTY